MLGAHGTLVQIGGAEEKVRETCPDRSRPAENVELARPPLRDRPRRVRRLHRAVGGDGTHFPGPATSSTGAWHVRSHTVVIGVAVGGGFVLAFGAAGHRLWIFGGGWPSIAAGLAIAASGVVFRTWAIVTLGRFFTYDVTIQPGHRVVTSGPYRWVRHPSYTGGLVGLLGLGVALGSAAAVLALVVVPLTGLLIRIRHEERTLRTALGAAYETYAADMPRLVPGIW